MPTAGPGRYGATSWAQVTRLSEIATVLWSSEFDWLVNALGLGACVSPRCRLHCAIGFEQCEHHVAMDRPLPQRLGAVLERLGPTFVKAGQMLALRPDLVPLPYADALRRLHSAAAPFASAQARRIVEDELGMPLARAFAHFEPEPFAAASLSQVHRATRHDGAEVAVKVLRPGIEETIESDLALLAALARRIERRRPESLAFRPTEAVAELADYTRRELDLRAEARTAVRMRALFADEPNLVVPRVYTDQSTKRVLVSEYVEGVHPAAEDQLKRLGIDPDVALTTGVRTMVDQIFRHGIFHADPHPGNVLLLPDNRVCLLDFGMFGRLAARQRQHMALVLWALVDGRYEDVGEHLLALATTRPDAEVDGFRHALSVEVEESFTNADGPSSVARLLLRELALGAEHGIVFVRDLMLLARALVQFESLARVVRADVNLTDLARPLLPQLQASLLAEVTDWGAGLAPRQPFDQAALALRLVDLLRDVGALRGAIRPRSPQPSEPARPTLPWWAPAIVGGLAGMLAARVARRRT